MNTRLDSGTTTTTKLQNINNMTTEETNYPDMRLWRHHMGTKRLIKSGIQISCNFPSYELSLFFQHAKPCPMRQRCV